MLSDFILQASVAGDHEAVIISQRSATWRQLQEETLMMFSTAKPLARRRVGLRFGAASESYAALAALDRLASDVFLFDTRTPLEEVLRLAVNLKLGAVACPGRNEDGPALSIRELANEEKASGGSTVTILTSGTTGEPKAATHSWASLCRPIRKSAKGSAPRWLLTYRPNLYAGLQVILQCFADRGTLISAEAEMDPETLAQFMVTSQVQFVSATPSFWRCLLIFVDAQTLRQIPLVQVTLGGEVVDQPLLDRLKKLFPQARLVHIYATTELGRCFAVSDGVAGFPHDYLGKVLPDGVNLKIEEGELLVQSPNSMETYDRYSSSQCGQEPWFRTGDTVEIQGNRVYFAGRKSDLINVAGNKVYPIEIERVVRTIPGVADVRVFGKASSIAGEIVACDIIPGSNQDPGVLKDAVIRTCRSQLATYQQPRIIRLVSHIELSLAGKALRTKVQ